MQRRRQVWAPVLAITLASGACRIQEVPRPERVAASDVARDEIANTRDAYRAALVRGDAAEIAAFFAADARLYEPGVLDIVGTRDIRDAFARFHAAGSVLDFSLERESIDVAEGGVAWEAGTYAETFVLADGEPQTVRGRYAIRWQRGPEAAWRIHRFLVNHYPAADSSATR